MNGKTVWKVFYLHSQEHKSLCDCDLAPLQASASMFLEDWQKMQPDWSPNQQAWGLPQQSLWTHGTNEERTGLTKTSCKAQRWRRDHEGLNGWFPKIIFSVSWTPFTSAHPTVCRKWEEVGVKCSFCCSEAQIKASAGIHSLHSCSPPFIPAFVSSGAWIKDTMEDRDCRNAPDVKDGKQRLPVRALPPVRLPLAWIRRRDSSLLSPLQSEFGLRTFYPSSWSWKTHASVLAGAALIWLPSLSLSKRNPKNGPKDRAESLWN